MDGITIFRIGHWEAEMRNISHGYCDKVLPRGCPGRTGICFQSQGASLEVLGEFSQPFAVPGNCLWLMMSSPCASSVTGISLCPPHGLTARTLRLDWGLS